MDCYVGKYVALITQPIALNIICLREESNTYFKNEVFFYHLHKEKQPVFVQIPLLYWGGIMGNSANDETKSRKQRKKVWQTLH